MTRTILGRYCKTCDTTYFSRARHDFNACPCWISSGQKTGGYIDGGRDYIKAGGSGVVVRIPVTQTDKELYQDWNTSTDKYKWIEGNTGTVVEYSNDKKSEDRMLTLKEFEQEITEDLKAQFGDETLVHVFSGHLTNIHVWVASLSFDGVADWTRHDRVWEVLNASLPENEICRVSLVLGFSPTEPEYHYGLREQER